MKTLMNTAVDLYARVVDGLRQADFVPALLLRAYLAPIFWMAGSNKLSSFDSTVQWFGNKEWGLGLPFPEFLAFMATATEMGGAVLLALGLMTRLITIPLIVTMLVAIFTVHWHNGWLAIAEGSGLFATERTMEAAERLGIAKEILREHGNYSYLTEHGSFVVLNNGIEFGVTYAIMLVALLFIGGGRWFSGDYWLSRYFSKESGR